jgi:hypothetical protein
MLGDHLDRDFGGALKIVGRASRNTAGEHQLFRCVAAHENSDSVLKVCLGKQKAVFRRPLDRVAERSDATRDDRDLLDRVDARQARGDEGVTHFVIGDPATLLLIEDPALLLEPSDHALDCSREVTERDMCSIATRRDDRGLVHEICEVRPSKSGRQRGDRVQIKFGRELHFSDMDFEDLYTALAVGPVDQDLPIEPPRPQLKPGRG